MKPKSRRVTIRKARPARGSQGQCILVAGMHRSGTSAVTRVINLLGADISRDLMPPIAGNNDRGFWESGALMKIHDQLLAALGRSWDDPFPLPEGWMRTSAGNEARAEIGRSLDQDFAKSLIFVVKDPRLCQLLPLWLSLLDERGVEPVVVLPFRNPLEVANSLKSRDGIPLAKSTLIYARFNLDAEIASRGRKRLFVDYGSMLSNWRRFAKRLRAVARPSIQEPNSDTAAEIDNFLTADLYRNRATRADLVTEPQVAKIATEIYDLLTEAARGGASADTALRRSFNRLDRMTADLAHMLQALLERSPAAAEVPPHEEVAPPGDILGEDAEADESSSDHASQVIHHALDLMAEARADLARRLDEMSTQATQLNEVRLSLASQIAAADANAAHAVNHMAALEATRADLAHKLSQAQAGAAELGAARDRLQRQLDEVRFQTQAVELKLQGAEARGDQEARQAERLRKELDEARSRIAELLTGRDAQESKIEEARERASELAMRLARFESTRANLTRQLGEARTRASEAQASKEVLKLELDQAHTDAQRLALRAQQADARLQQQTLEIEVLTKDLERRTLQIEALTKDLDLARSGDAEQGAMRDTLQREVEEARSRAQALETQAREAGTRAEQVALQNKGLRQQLEEARNQSASLQAGRDTQESERLAAEVAELTRQLEEARAGAEAANAARDTLQRDLGEARAAAQGVEDARMAAQSGVARAEAAEANIQQLSAQIELLSRELRQTRATTEELRRGRDTSDRQVALLTKELEQARASAKEVQAGRDALRLKIEEARSEAQSLAARAHTADTQAEQQAWQIELLAKDLDVARGRAADLTARRDLLQRQIEEAGWEPKPTDAHGAEGNGQALCARSNGSTQHFEVEMPEAEAPELSPPAITQVPEDLPRLDPVYYAERNPDVAAAGIDLLTHYMEHGRWEGRRAEPVAADLVVDESRFDPEKETIILVSHEASRTGAPILALNIAEHLCAKYNIVAILLREGPLVENFKEISSQVVCVADTDRHPVEHRYLVNAILRERPIRYAVVNSIASCDLVPALGATSVPIVTLIHEFSSHARPLSAVRDALIWSTELVFSTDIAVKSFRKEHAVLLKGGVHVLPQGPCRLPASAQQVDLDAEIERLKAGMRPTGSENALVVLGIGFVHLRKGIDLFLASAAAVLRLNPDCNVRFVWIGHGYDPDWELMYSVYLKEQIARSGLQDHVVILDEVGDLDPAYAMADVFYLSSRLDPLPNVTIDAALRGLPIICFDKATGMAEVLRKNAAASVTVVPYLDTEAAAQLILKLAHNKRLRTRIGKATRAVAEAAFDMERYIEEIDKVGELANASIRQRRKDFETIANDSAFDCGYSRLTGMATTTREEAIERYLAYWANARPALRPFPGFHSQIYAELHPELIDANINPLADFIRSGHPDGPWMNKVIRADAADWAPPAPELRTAIQAHFHYPELIEEFLAKLAVNERPCDLLLSTNDELKAELLRTATERYERGKVEVRVFQNRGRDIAPLLTGYAKEVRQNYDVIGHLHAKRSLGVDGAMGEVWREFLWQHLIGDRFAMMDLVSAQFTKEKQLGLIFAEDPHLCGWDENLAIAEELARQTRLQMPLPKFFNFPIGTMFWARTAALAPLFELELDWADYPPEPLANDGTMLHALERLLPFAAAKQDFTYATLHIPGITR